MSKNRGRMKWCPQVVIVELEDIKEEYKIDKDAPAFHELVKAARIGREVNRLAKLDFFGRLPTKEFPSDKKKKKLPKSLMGGDVLNVC